MHESDDRPESQVIITDSERTLEEMELLDEIEEISPEMAKKIAFDSNPYFEDVIEYSKKVGITMDQLILASYLSIPKNLRPLVKDMAKKFGVDKTTVWKWSTHPGVIEITDILIGRVYNPHIADMVEAQKTLALAGDTGAFTALMRHLGRGKINEKAKDSGATINVFVTPDALTAWLGEVREKNKVIDVEASPLS